MNASRWVSMSLAVVWSVTVVAGPVGAQATRPPAPGAAPFSEIETSLTRIEAGLGQIEKSQRITEKFDPDTEVAAYRDQLRKAYDATMQAVQEDAKKASESKAGASAAGTRLQAWETKAKNHRGRVEKVLNRLMTINLKIRDGNILIAPELLRKLPAEETEELRKWLTPGAIKKYQAIDKSFFASSAMDYRNWLGWVHDAVAPQAEAAVAIACVPVCSGQPAACIPCVAAAVGVGSFLVSKLDQAFTDCDKLRTRFLRGACKVGAVLALITIIA